MNFIKRLIHAIFKKKPDTSEIKYLELADRLRAVESELKIEREGDYAPLLRRVQRFELDVRNKFNDLMIVGSAVGNTTVQQLFTNKPASVLYAVANPSSFPADTTALTSNQTLCPSISDRSLYLWNGNTWTSFISNSGSPTTAMVSFQFDSVATPYAESLIRTTFGGTILAASISGNPGGLSQADIQLNGVAIPGLTNLTFNTGVATFNVTGTVTFAPGDYLGLALSGTLPVTNFKVFLIYK